VVEAGIDDFASEYYLANLSPAALESMERPDGPFDDEYFLVVYETADAFQADADAAFIEANRLAKIANRYQLVAFALAVGLSFTAWSSLSNANLRIRWLFAILSVLTLLASLGALLLAFLTNLFS
jgi:hypothetical protein